MAVPKKRKSKSRTRQGRSHHALKGVIKKLHSLVQCKDCQEYRLSHRECRCKTN